MAGSHDARRSETEDSREEKVSEEEEEEVGLSGALLVGLLVGLGVAYAATGSKATPSHLRLASRRPIMLPLKCSMCHESLWLETEGSAAEGEELLASSVRPLLWSDVSVTLPSASV